MHSASSVTLVSSPDTINNTDSFIDMSHPHPTRRFSRRLAFVHFLHALMLFINIAIFITGMYRWEYRVAVDVDQASKVSSYLSAAFQAFFTASLAIMFALSQAIAIDRYIRNSASLLALHSRLSAWSGLGASVFAIGRFLDRKSGHLFRQFLPLFAICIYFLAGSVLQIASSSVVGVSVYNSTGWSSESVGTNFMGDYSGIPVSTLRDDASKLSSEIDSGVRGAARQSMFLASVNNTRYPGLQGRLFHDTVLPGQNPYELASVNATVMNIRCYQPPDATVNMFLMPPDSNDTSLATYPDASGYLANPNEHVRDDAIWLNVSMPAPPYWDPEVPGLNFTTLWSERPYYQYLYDQPWSWPVLTSDSAPDVLNYSLPMQFTFQPWAFSNDPDVKLGHHQVVFVLASTDPNAMVRDSNGDMGRVYNYTVRPARDKTLQPKCMEGCDLFRCEVSPEDFRPLCRQMCSEMCYERFNFTTHVQVIGCDLRTSALTVNITTDGFLSSDDSWNVTEPHAWEDFHWEPQTDVLIDRQMVDIFAPSVLPFSQPVPLPSQRQLAGPEYLLKRSFSAEDGWTPIGVNLSALEGTMEHLAASYFWNFRQLCDDPLTLAPSFSGCDDFRSPSEFPQGRMASVDLMRTITRARLEVVRWRASVSVGCSVILFLLAIILLGVETSLEPDENFRQAGIIDIIALMRGSSLPDIAGRYSAMENLDRNVSDESPYLALRDVNIRYGSIRSKTDEDVKFVNLDESFRVESFRVQEPEP